VLDDPSFSSGSAEVWKFKAELHQTILKLAKNYLQKELQKILGGSLSRV
jgi:hypothetical protein